MRRTTSRDAKRYDAKRDRRGALPVVEGLEERWALSQAGGALPVAAAANPSGGVFSHEFRQFNYRTPSGARVKLQMVGRGSLEGTTVDQGGALHLLFSKTNAYTKIMSTVHGGNGRAPLASIHHRDLFLHGATQSLSGIGGSVIKTINLPSFDLIAGGVINVTEGINTLALNSAAPDTQILIRELPPSVTAGASSTPSTGSGSSIQVISDVFLVQSLAGINGEFVSAGNIVQENIPGNPGPPPAPPGVILKINHIRGNINPVPNLLTDARIYGYNETTGQVVRFSLDLTKAGQFQGTGTVDASFAPLTVQPPGGTQPVGLSVGRDGDRQVLLVSLGTTITAYDATFGTNLGSFTRPAGFDALGSTDTISVMGNITTNELQMVDIPASLASGVATLPPDNPTNYTPPGGFGLVGGLTGLPGSNRVYATAAAVFNSFEPTVTQLGLLTVGTSMAAPKPDGGLRLIRGFTTDAQKAFQRGGGYTAVTPSNNPDLIGVPVGSVDSNLAINRPTPSASNPAQFDNTIALVGPESLRTKGAIVLKTSDKITDLSEAFRPDLNGSPADGVGPVLVDVQGNVQSLRGLTANGLVLNNTGYLNLIRLGKISNSTILASPIGHVKTPENHRVNVSLISSADRDFGTRGGVTLVPGLLPVGPLSLTNDRPAP